jgi:hypothetical protein
MHRRCHASLRYIQAIANTTADGPRNVASASAINCASCAEARITQAAHRGTLSTPAPEAGVLHVDLKEMVISAEGFRYFLVAVDSSEESSSSTAFWSTTAVGILVAASLASTFL